MGASACTDRRNDESSLEQLEGWEVVNETKTKTTAGPVVKRKEEEKVCFAAQDFKLHVESHAQYNSEKFACEVPDFLAMTTVECPAYEQENRVGVDIVCVLDRSGSMAGDRISLVRKAIRRLIRNLQDQDRIALIAFDTQVDLLLPFTNMTADGKRNAKNIIGALDSRSSTDLCGGLLKGIELLQQDGNGNEVQAILLFTDGQANHGISSELGILNRVREVAGLCQDASQWSVDEVREWLMQMNLGMYAANFGRNGIDGQMLLNDLTDDILMNDLGVKRLHLKKFERQIDKLRGIQVEGEGEGTTTGNGNRGFQLHTFGFGANHNVSLLETLANEFDGMYYFMENEKAIIDGFAACLGGLLAVATKNIEVTFRPAPGVQDFMVKKREGKQVNKDGSVTIRFGDLHAGETKHIVVSGTLPIIANADSNYVMFTGSIKYRNCIQDCSFEEQFFCTVNRSGQRGAADHAVDVANNRAVSADVLKQAETFAEIQKFDSAREIINATIDKIDQSCSNNDEWCVSAVRDLTDALEGLQNARTYKQRGYNYLVQNRMCMEQERTVNFSDDYACQQTYVLDTQNELQAEFMRCDSCDSAAISYSPSPKRGQAYWTTQDQPDQYRGRSLSFSRSMSCDSLQGFDEDLLRPIELLPGTPPSITPPSQRFNYYLESDSPIGKDEVNLQALDVMDGIDSFRGKPRQDCIKNSGLFLRRRRDSDTES